MLDQKEGELLEVRNYIGYKAVYSYFNGFRTSYPIWKGTWTLSRKMISEKEFHRLDIYKET